MPGVRGFTEQSLTKPCCPLQPGYNKTPVARRLGPAIRMQAQAERLA